MKHEAKFSVIVPAEQFTSEQIETFEAVTQKYGLPVVLPLRNDGRGNFIAAQGLNLRDAQGLRRKISGLGYPADVVSDASEDTRVSSLTPDTLVVDAINPDDFDLQPSVGDITADAWSSLEMPALDLGLFDANDGDDAKASAQKEEKTLSLSAADLFKAAEAKSSGIAPRRPQAQSETASNVPLLDFKRSEPNLMSSAPSGAGAPKDPAASHPSLANVKLSSSGAFSAGDGPSLEIDESSLCALSKEIEKSAQSEDASRQTAAEKDPSAAAAPNAPSEAVCDAGGIEAGGIETAPKRSHPLLACLFLAAVVLIALMCIDIYVTPIAFMESLSVPLF